MMIRWCITVAAVMAIAIPLSAARPDFSGEWRLAVEKSDFAQQAPPRSRVIEIDHRDPTLILRNAEDDGRGPIEGTLFHSTDGIERTNHVAGNPMKAVTKWADDQLEMVTTGNFGPNEIRLVDRYELLDGRLVIRRHFEGKGPRGPMPSQDQVLVHEAVALRAGIARVELTPSQMLAMYGYANRRCGPAATGTHDPLFAKVLVLESARNRIAIVTADLGNLVSDRIGREAKQQHGVALTLLAASHSHSAPTFTGQGEYLAEVESKIIRAIGEAAGQMFNARLRIGKGVARLGYNRLVLREHGRARALFDNLERVPQGPLDEEFQLLEVTDVQGEAKALLVHYAVHSVVLGSTNCLYSADYPGAMQTAIEKGMPGVQAMFVQGGAGDVNPIFQGRSGNTEADFALVDRMGGLLAGAVLRARASLQPVAAGTSIRFEQETMRFSDRWKKEAPAHEIGIATMRIGRDIAIAAMPGEPLHRLQTMWKHESGVAQPLFYGYTYSGTGEWPSYLPDLRSAALGGYGADNTTTFEPGAGERIVQRHLIHLFGLQGMWQPQPGQN